MSVHDWSLLRELLLCQQEEHQQALRSLTTARQQSVAAASDRLLHPTTHMHRGSVAACGRAVTLVRLVAIAPLRQFLQPVPRLDVWSLSNPDGGTLPDAAYLPQDYITQVRVN